MGNPVTTWGFMAESGLRFAYHHSLIDEESWWDVVKECCGPDHANPGQIPNDYCHFDGCKYNATIREVSVFPYNVYKRCSTKPGLEQTREFSGLQEFQDYMKDLRLMRRPQEIYCSTPGEFC